MTITLTYDSDDELRRKCEAILERLRPVECTVGELAQMCGRRVSTTSKALYRVSCPHYAARRGPSGRIVALTPNPRLMRFLKA